MRDWAYRITGDRAADVRAQGPQSVKKVKVLASVVLLPAFIWLGLGYGFGSHFLLLDTIASMGCGLIAGGVVFTIDRLIILMSSTNRSLLGLRILLGVIIALLGSVVMDHILFAEDIRMTMDEIKAQRIEQKMEAMDEAFQAELEMKQDRVQETFDIAQQRQMDYLQETDGSGGTRYRGIGDVAKAKYDVWIKAQSDHQEAQNQYDALRSDLAQRKKSIQEAEESSFAHSAILTQVKAMFLFLRQEPVALVLWIPFSLLMFLIEVIPVLTKTWMDESSYERELRHLEEMNKRRIDLMNKEHMDAIAYRSRYSEGDRQGLQLLHRFSGSDKQAS